jgi:hypothetical protein
MMLFIGVKNIKKNLTYMVKKSIIDFGDFNKNGIK